MVLLASFSAFASSVVHNGSLDCKLTKNSTIIPLSFSLGEDYEEENTELYYGVIDKIKADVLYLPHQYGIVVTLTGDNVKDESEGETEASASLSINGNTYTLSCEEL